MIGVDERVRKAGGTSHRGSEHRNLGQLNRGGTTRTTTKREPNRGGSIIGKHVVKLNRLRLEQSLSMGRMG